MVFLHFPRELDPLQNVQAPRTDILNFHVTLVCYFYAVVRKIKYALFYCDGCIITILQT